MLKRLWKRQPEKTPKKTPKKTIAVLIEAGATAGYLLSSLKDEFNGKANVITINSQDVLKTSLFGNNVLDKTDVLFIPGVQRASSSYREGLGQKGGQKIRQWVKNGGTAIGLCQGAYLLTKKFQYADKYSGVTRVIHSPCGIFEGVAHGPIHDYTNRQDLENPFADHHVAKLEFNDAAKGAACYAHGPWLELPENASPEEYQVIARYADIHKQPIAIAKRQFGKGKAVFCGVVPEISGEEMGAVDSRLISGNTPNAHHLRTGILFAQNLAAHEAERQKTWDRLIAEIKLD